MKNTFKVPSIAYALFAKEIVENADENGSYVGSFTFDDQSYSLEMSAACLLVHRDPEDSTTPVAYVGFNRCEASVWDDDDTYPDPYDTDFSYKTLRKMILNLYA